MLKSTDFDLALGCDQSCLCFENNEDLRVIKEIIAAVLHALICVSLLIF